MIIDIIKNIIFARKVPSTNGEPELATKMPACPADAKQSGGVLAPVCPKCQSKEVLRRGFRKKKLEKIQLFQCKNCGATFTPQFTKGKHYPLEIIFDAMSFYNLGYSLEEVCRKITNFNLQPSTLAAWMKEFSGLCRYSRMRDFAIKLFSPEDAIVTATLAHRQLYRFRFHRAKCRLLMQEHFKHSQFGALKEFLELVPCECPHQYFSDDEDGKREYAGLRASEAPLAFSKTAMIIRSKTNFANQLTAFVLQTVKENKRRHEALQKFMFYNDSVTVATEVPVYLMREDLLHMQSQLGFQIYQRASQGNTKPNSPATEINRTLEAKSLPKADATIAEADITEIALNELPKLITGHIDILQIRNGMIHILDYKPNAAKERPIEQLTLYAMALSRLTGLRLFEFKCAWFDEKDYFEFYPLHVLHKTKKASRRRKVETIEGTYAVNKNEKKIENLRPEISREAGSRFAR